MTLKHSSFSFSFSDKACHLFTSKSIFADVRIILFLTFLSSLYLFALTKCSTQLLTYFSQSVSLFKSFCVPTMYALSVSVQSSTVVTISNPSAVNGPGFNAIRTASAFFMYFLVISERYFTGSLSPGVSTNTTSFGILKILLSTPTSTSDTNKCSIVCEEVYFFTVSCKSSRF